MQPDFRGSRRNDVCEDCRVAECKTSEHRDGVVLLPRAGCLVPSLTCSIADIYLSNETISEWKRGQSCDPVASRLPHVHMGLQINALFLSLVFCFFSFAFAFVLAPPRSHPISSPSSATTLGWTAFRFSVE